MDEVKYEIIPVSAIIVGCVGVIFFGGATILDLSLNMRTILKNTNGALLFEVFGAFFGCLSLLSLYLILYCQKIIIADEYISIKRIKKTYSLRYSEITYFYEGAGNINTGNETRQLSFPAYEHWNGKNKKAAFIFLITKLEKNNVTPKISMKGIIPHLKGFKYL
jgi:hypothetical protein